MKITGRHILFLITIFIFSFFPNQLKGAPVTLEKAQYHVTILKDGKAEVLYQLTFREHESQNMIRTIGQFIQPMTILESYGTHGKKKFNFTHSLSPPETRRF